MSFDKEYLSKLKVELLARDKHNRASFSCGVERIDNFLKISASRHADKDFGKVYVAIQSPENDVLGFYAISPHSIDVKCLSADDQKRLLRHSTVPAIYLSMIGVTVTKQGRGMGVFLMMEALKKCVEGANIMGGHFVVMDAIDENAARLYSRIGFIRLASQPGRMIFSINTVRKAVSLVK